MQQGLWAALLAGMACTGADLGRVWRVQAIMERERGNPTYAFLFDLASPLHHYYRWRVFSFAQGDTLTRWRVDPFVMVQGGPRWLPPPLPDDSADKKQEQPTAAAGKGRVSLAGCGRP